MHELGASVIIAAFMHTILFGTYILPLIWQFFYLLFSFARPVCVACMDSIIYKPLIHIDFMELFTLWLIENFSAA